MAKDGCIYFGRTPICNAAISLPQGTDRLKIPKRVTCEMCKRIRDRKQAAADCNDKQEK